MSLKRILLSFGFVLDAAMDGPMVSASVRM
jgi:hypothetical protein